MDKCFACGKALKGQRYLVDTRDDQTVYVGPDCFKRVREAGEKGYSSERYLENGKWQMGAFGPKLYLIKNC